MLLKQKNANKFDQQMQGSRSGSSVVNSPAEYKYGVFDYPAL
jgi:hypothetical protein